MFSDRRLLRRIAARMLFAWLLALTTGIVNACLLESHTVPSVGLAASAAVAHEHGASPTSNPACVKFCSDPSVSTQSGQSQLDANIVLLAPPPARPVVTEAATARIEAAAIDAGDRREAVPIPIALLRLTL